MAAHALRIAAAAYATNAYLAHRPRGRTHVFVCPTTRAGYPAGRPVCARPVRRVRAAAAPTCWLFGHPDGHPLCLLCANHLARLEHTLPPRIPDRAPLTVDEACLSLWMATSPAEVVATKLLLLRIPRLHRALRAYPTWWRPSRTNGCSGPGPLEGHIHAAERAHPTPEQAAAAERAEQTRLEDDARRSRQIMLGNVDHEGRPWIPRRRRTP